MQKQCKSETEVYSRVVGFYRPTKLWNFGKKAEFGLRKEYSMPTLPSSNSKKERVVS